MEIYEFEIRDQEPQRSWLPIPSHSLVRAQTPIDFRTDILIDWFTSGLRQVGWRKFSEWLQLATHSSTVLGAAFDLRMPLVDELVVDPLSAGSALLVEFDPASQWYATSMSIAAVWLKTGGTITYVVNGQPPENVRIRFRELGVDVDTLEKDERLVIIDGYTLTLGRKSNEKYAAQSLKVADMSITFSREVMQAGPIPELLTIVDNFSTVARFNDERAWIEFILTRGFPSAFLTKSTTFVGIITGVHPDYVYKQLEAAADGVIDLKLDATSDPPRNLIRIRSMRNVRFDGRWREIECGSTFEVKLKG